MENDIQSKTKKKQEDKQLQHLAAQLAALAIAQTDEMDLSSELHEALALARKTTAHGARRRQIRYIGSLLRHIDTAPIMQALSAIEHGCRMKALAHKRIESWRDAFIQGETDPLAEIIDAFPNADRQKLVQLALNARKEAATGERSKASRALFRYLKEIADKNIHDGSRRHDKIVQHQE